MEGKTHRQTDTGNYLETLWNASSGSNINKETIQTSKIIMKLNYGSKISIAKSSLL